MSKHSGPPAPEERNRIAVATVAVVGVIGLVVAVLAIFHPESTAPSAADLATARPTTSLTATPPAGQEIRAGSTLARAPKLAAPTVAPQKVNRVVGQLRRKTEVAAQVPPTVFRVSTFN